MAVLTANDFAAQMIAQARVLDPSFSGEVGTPERKIIDTVAQSLADNQVDLTGLQSALDIDAKWGGNLDRFTALFGMQRQQAMTATGYVTFSRVTPATATITIPSGTLLQATINSNTDTLNAVQFTTTASGTIAINQTTSGAIPIQCVVTGTVGNVAANTITQMVGAPVVGVTSVTNPNPLVNGANIEDDNSFKVRFKNTWARNLAGTEDQYLALAVAGAFTTKAVVVGPQSRYHEYIQVPSYDDTGYLAGTQTAAYNTFGTANQWTSALSTIPYAKQIYTTTATFVSNGQSGPEQVFYRPNVDYQFNFPAINSGDTLRNAPNTTLNGAVTLPAATITVTSTGRPTVGPVTNPFPTTGALNVGGQIVFYTGVTATTFTGCTGGVGTIATGTPVYYVPPATQQPNFLFLNVYNPSSTQTITGLQALAPGNVVLSEFSYVSNASRNDISHNVTNAVDVYVNGSNPVQTSTVVLPNAIISVVNNNPNSPWYYENYRRDGQPAKRPHLNNYLTPLFQSPLTALPPTITLNGVVFNLGVDYWLVHEVDSLGGSVRSRDAIEWNVNSSPGNNIATASAPGLNPVIPLEVDNYYFDANIPTLQAAIESSRQITTDVLVHQARTRYFKLDITVMYTNNSTYSVTNAGIASSLQAFFANQYFGTVIQLSDLLEVIHEVQGVDNVRWSNDLPTIPNLIRVYETDVNGNPLHGASVDRLIYGTGTVKEQQTLYVVGSPSGINNNVADSFTLSWPGVMTTAAIPFLSTTSGAPVTAAQIQSAIQAVQPASGIYNGVTITQDSRPTVGVSRPILSFTITYGANGVATVPTVTNTVTASQYAFDGDFFLQDNELPSLPTGQVTGDTLPGLIIRTRAQNTFLRPGLF